MSETTEVNDFEFTTKPFPIDEITNRIPSSILDTKYFGAYWMFEQWLPVAHRLDELIIDREHKLRALSTKLQEAEKGYKVLQDMFDESLNDRVRLIKENAEQKATIERLKAAIQFAMKAINDEADTRAYFTLKEALAK